MTYDEAVIGEMVSSLTDEMVENLMDSHISTQVHEVTCVIVGIDPTVTLGGEEIDENHPKYRKYYEVNNAVWIQLLSAAIFKLSRPVA